MEIVKGLENIREKRESVITLGTFDGLHAGHKKIIDKVVEAANNANIQSVLVTFEPHPRLVLNNSKEPIRLLSTIEEKIEILSSFKLDTVIIVDFDKEFANNSYQDFVEKILIDQLGMKHLVIGYDHHFGKNRKGNFSSLKELAAQHGFSITKVNPLYVEDTLVSSSLVRSCLREGKVRVASNFLGRQYKLKGVVVQGDGRGKKLTFPTANIEIIDIHKIIPMNGVYAVDVMIKGQQHKGMMNIGFRPTFENNKHAVEVHIFGLDENIYNEKLTVYFKKRLRKEIRFSSKEELIKQLEIDKEKSLHL